MNDDDTEVRHCRRAVHPGVQMNIKELLALGQSDDVRFTKKELEEFAELVAAHERGECAKVVDHILKEGGGTYGDAIRARCKA